MIFNIIILFFILFILYGLYIFYKEIKNAIIIDEENNINDTW